MEIKNKDMELLPKFTKDMLRNTLFGYLSNDCYTRRQLERHPQFTQLPEYKRSTFQIEFLQCRLLEHVAKGRKEEAEDLLESNQEILPHLLTYSGKIKTYATSIKGSVFVEGTPLGIALGAEDVNVYDQYGNLRGTGMVEMLLRYLRRLPDSEELIISQTLKQFPEGWEAREEKRHAADLIALRKVRDAIIASSDYEACKKAIREFKIHLAPKKVITDGKHWNAKLLQAAFEKKSNLYFYNNRKALFYCEIVNYIQFLAPANYGMAQAQGFKNLVENGENFKRDFKYQNGTDHYYPLNSTVGDVRSGAGSWVECYYGYSRGLENTVGPCAGHGFQDYLEAKTKVLQQFMPLHDGHSHTRHRCILM